MKRFDVMDYYHTCASKFKCNLEGIVLPASYFRRAIDGKCYLYSGVYHLDELCLTHHFVKIYFPTEEEFSCNEERENGSSKIPHLPSMLSFGDTERLDNMIFNFLRNFCDG